MVETVIHETADIGPSLEAEAAAMEAAAKAKEAEEPKLAGEEENPERPEWLPEKFETVEDMAKAYAELEKAQGAKKSDETAEGDENAAEETAQKAVEDAGLDMDALSAEYAENGELSEESLEALAKVGITKEIVDQFIAGQEAAAAATQAELLGPVGDMETYGKMIEWAGSELPDAEIDAFNAVLQNGDIAATKMAVENLWLKYSAKNDIEPGRSLSGKASAGQSVYESTADLMKDMQNPEYRTNPAFRAKVEAKLARSNIM